MKINFRGINSQLLSNAEAYVAEWLPGGKRVGAEYLAYNPTRADKTLGSFSINLQTGKWMDGSSGDSGGDIISLYAYINKVSQGQSARELSEKYLSAAARGATQSTTTKTEVARPATSPHGIICSPVPTNAPRPPDKLKIGGSYLAPSMVHRYTDADGAVLRYIYRFDATPENRLPKKEFRPLTCWREIGGRLVWRYKDIPDNRPLYGLRELAAKPDAPVLVVSGEKCADAARAQLPDHVVVTWSGGDKVVRKTDFAPLSGRELIWWPDNDDSSKNSMRQLAKQFGGRIVVVPEKYPKGWDCADAVASGIDISTLLKQVQCLEIVKRDYPPLSERAPDHIFPHVTPKGKPLGTIENIAALMDYYGLEVWYNEVTKRLGCSVAGVESKDGDRINHFRALVKSTCVLNGITSRDVGEFVDYIAARRRKNPVREWIESKPWDGVARVKEVIDSVVCNDGITSEFRSILMLKWMVSAYAAAARVDGDDFRLRGTVVFQGAQSIGKTAFLRDLCGRRYGGSDEWFGEGMTFNPEKIDDIVKANRYWIMEFGELENTTKHGVAALKAYLTNPVNTIRFKYAREETVIWSRTVYAGTVNPNVFLPDMTGNSRFWCIPVVRFDDISHIDMQQVWAEIKRYYDTCIADGDKYIWWLSPEEESTLGESNLQHESPSTAADLLGERLNWGAPKEKWREITCTELLEECGVRVENTKSFVTAAGIYLHKQGLSCRHNGKSRVYLAPPRKDHTSATGPPNSQAPPREAEAITWWEK